MWCGLSAVWGRQAATGWLAGWWLLVLGMDDREGGRKDDSDLIDIEESEMTILYLIFNDEAKLFVGLHLKFNSFRNSQCNYIEYTLHI